MSWSLALAHVLLPQGQPEIRHIGLAVGVQQDVAGLDVPVDQPLAMSGVQRPGHHRHQFHGFRHGRPVVLDPLRQRAAFDVLRHDEKGAILGAAHVMHGNDMRVVEAGDGAGFGQVGFGVFGPGNKSGVRHLDGDRPLQLLVVGQVDDTEAASAQDSLHPVAADALRPRSGTLVNGGRLVWTRLVEVVHGQGPRIWCFVGTADYTRWGSGSPSAGRAASRLSRSAAEVQHGLTRRTSIRPSGLPTPQQDSHRDVAA
jgi:hypothetical protein